MELRRSIWVVPLSRQAERTISGGVSDEVPLESDIVKDVNCTSKS